MKPFDLEAAKRGEPIVTRDGRKAKFVAYVPDVNEYQRMVCVVGDEVLTYTEDGRYTGNPCNRDLFMAPPPMRSINGYEYPEPVREPLKKGDFYWFANPFVKSLASEYSWWDTTTDFNWLKRGLIQATEEGAKAQSRAIILAGGGEV